MYIFIRQAAMLLQLPRYLYLYDNNIYGCHNVKN